MVRTIIIFILWSVGIIGITSYHYTITAYSITDIVFSVYTQGEESRFSKLFGTMKGSIQWDGDFVADFMLNNATKALKEIVQAQ